MKTIKYRAYNDTTKTMHYFDILQNGKGQHLFPSYWYCTKCETYCDPTDLSEPMLTTNLKDRTNQEIYKEDIVRWQEALGDATWKVDWDNEYAGFVLVLVYAPFHEFPKLNICRVTEMEVIGNIWENPELIEVKND